MPRQFLLAMVLTVAIILPSSCSRSRSEDDKETVRSLTPVPTWTSTATPQPRVQVVPTDTPSIQPTDTPTVQPTDIPEVATATVAPIVPTEAPTSSPYASQANGDANLRSGPGTDYPVVGSLEQNALLRILARTDDGSWYQIETPEKQVAWIASFLVNDAPAITDIAVTTEIPTPLPVPISTSNNASDSIQIPATVGNIHQSFLQRFVPIANEATQYFPDKEGYSSRAQYEILNEYKTQLEEISAPEGYANLMHIALSLHVLSAAGTHLNWDYGDLYNARYYGDEAVYYYGEYLGYRMLYLREIGVNAEEAGFQE